MEMLSPHISRTEFEHSDVAIARGLANLMPDGLVPAAQALCLILLEPIRAHFGQPLILHSGYRSRALNRALGSQDASQHRRGEAADIVLASGPSNDDLARWIATCGLPFDQLILEAHHRGEPRSGWVHVSYTRARPPRRDVLTMTIGSHGAVYQRGLPT